MHTPTTEKTRSSLPLSPSKNNSCFKDVANLQTSSKKIMQSRRPRSFEENQVSLKSHSVDSYIPLIGTNFYKEKYLKYLGLYEEMRFKYESLQREKSKQIEESIIKMQRMAINHPKRTGPDSENRKTSLEGRDNAANEFCRKLPTSNKSWFEKFDSSFIQMLEGEQETAEENMNRILNQGPTFEKKQPVSFNARNSEKSFKIFVKETSGQNLSQEYFKPSLNYSKSISRRWNSESVIKILKNLNQNYVGIEPKEFLPRGLSPEKFSEDPKQSREGRIPKGKTVSSHNLTHALNSTLQSLLFSENSEKIGNTLIENLNEDEGGIEIFETKNPESCAMLKRSSSMNGLHTDKIERIIELEQELDSMNLKHKAATIILSERIKALELFWQTKCQESEEVSEKPNKPEPSYLISGLMQLISLDLETLKNNFESNRLKIEGNIFDFIEKDIDFLKRLINESKSEASDPNNVPGIELLKLISSSSKELLETKRSYEEADFVNQTQNLLGERLLKQNEELRQKETELTVLQKESEKLQKKHDYIVKLNVKRDEKIKELNQLNGRLETNCKQLEEGKRNLLEKIDNLEARLKTAENLTEGFNQERENIKNDYDKKIIDLEKKLNEYQAKNDERRKNYLANHSKLKEDVEKKINMFLTEKRELEEKLNMTKRELEQKLLQRNAEVFKKMSEISELRQETQKLNALLEKKSKEINSLNKKISINHECYENLQHRFQESKAENDRITTEIEQHVTRNQDFHALLISKSEEIDELMKLLREQEEECENIKISIAREKAEMKKIVMELEAENSKGIKLLEESKRENEAQRIELQLTKKQAETTEKNMAGEIESLKKELENISKANAEREKEGEVMKNKTFEEFNKKQELIDNLEYQLDQERLLRTNESTKFEENIKILENCRKNIENENNLLKNNSSLMIAQQDSRIESLQDELENVRRLNLKLLKAENVVLKNIIKLKTLLAQAQLYFTEHQSKLEEIDADFLQEKWQDNVDDSLTENGHELNQLEFEEAKNKENAELEKIFTSLFKIIRDSKTFRVTLNLMQTDLKKAYSDCWETEQALASTKSELDLLKVKFEQVSSELLTLSTEKEIKERSPSGSPKSLVKASLSKSQQPLSNRYVDGARKRSNDNVQGTDEIEISRDDTSKTQSEEKESAFLRESIGNIHRETDYLGPRYYTPSDDPCCSNEPTTDFQDKEINVLPSAEESGLVNKEIERCFVGFQPANGKKYDPPKDNLLEKNLKLKELLKDLLEADAESFQTEEFYFSKIINQIQNLRKLIGSEQLNSDAKYTIEDGKLILESRNHINQLALLLCEKKNDDILFLKSPADLLKSRGNLQNNDNKLINLKGELEDDLLRKFKDSKFNFERFPFYQDNRSSRNIKRKKNLIEIEENIGELKDKFLLDLENIRKKLNEVIEDFQKMENTAFKQKNEIISKNEAIKKLIDENNKEKGRLKQYFLLGFIGSGLGGLFLYGLFK